MPRKDYEPVTNRKLFWISFVLTVAVLLGVMWADRPQERLRPPKLIRVSAGVFTTSQLQPDHVRFLRSRVRTLIDIRPDGEIFDQPPSSALEAAAKKVGMSFRYIPVPHENIPDSAVNALGRALAEERAPVLLYCRTGRRAVRTFALVEASRAGGPAADDILEMVKEAGLPAEDLKDEIARRTSQRKSIPQANPQ